ncbi:MAG: response regulator, partial [Halobacteriovoraceae bacterium]|nr:response regulator [Halobacteriovoraceae bacterium]
MSTKLLVVDDSKNIQKVVGIILGDKDFEIRNCSSYGELEAILSDFSPELVLLDFGISEEKSAYEITKEIKEHSSAKVIMLYGTFDNVDENLIEESHVDDHIFKPFDGDKLTKVCEMVLGETFGERTGAREGLIEQLEETPVNNEETITKVVPPEDALGDESGWGIKIPSIIGVEEHSGEDSQLNEDLQRIPDIIEDTDIDFKIEENFKELSEPVAKKVVEPAKEIPTIMDNFDEEEEQTLYPSDEDLEYPDVIEPEPIELEADDEDTDTKTLDIEVADNRPIEFQTSASSSQLISSEDLLKEPDPNEDTNDSTEIVDMNMTQEQEEESLSRLKKQILDELDEDAWQDDDNTNTRIMVGSLGKDTIDSSIDRDALRADIIEEIRESFYKDIKKEIIAKLNEELPKILKNDLIPVFEENI